MRRHPAHRPTGPACPGARQPPRRPERPVVAQANIDLDGRLVRAQVRAKTDREALDLLEDRLRNRLQHHVGRTVGNWEDRRGRGALSMAGPQPGADPTSWRHGDLPTRRVPFYPRPPAERQIVRHMSFAVAAWGIDEAVVELETLDYDFHLFTEVGTGQDSAIDRGGPTGYRLAQVEPHPEGLARHVVEDTVRRSSSPSTGSAVVARCCTTSTTATTASSLPPTADAGRAPQCGPARPGRRTPRRGPVPQGNDG